MNWIDIAVLAGLAAMLAFATAEMMLSSRKPSRVAIKVDASSRRENLLRRN